MSEQQSSDAEPRRVSGRVVVIVGLIAAAAVIALTLVARGVFPALTKQRALIERTKCQGTLRNLGLAALQYADDKGALPQVWGPEALAGGIETADGPRALRMLITSSYLDTHDPLALLCPAVSRRRTRDEATRTAQGEWLLGQRDALPPGDDTLLAMEDLSYGWTRRPLGPNAPSTTPLAADKATIPRGGPEVPGVPGNHVGGWNVVRADGSASWLSVDDEPFPGAWLTATEDSQTDGFLGILPQTDPSLLRRE